MQMAGLGLAGGSILIVAEHAIADIIATALRLENAAVARAVTLDDAKADSLVTQVDAVVLDFNVDFGAAVLQFIRKGAPGVPYVVYAPPSIEAAVQAMQAGAAEVVNDRHGLPDLVPALAKITQPRATRVPMALRPLQRLRLTEREREVLELIVRGMSNREIGAKLKISVRTVELHRARVMKKAGAHNLAELMRAVVGPR